MPLQSQLPRKPVPPIGVFLLGVYLIVSIFVEVALTVEFWPVPVDEPVITETKPPEGDVLPGEKKPAKWQTHYTIFGSYSGDISRSARLIVLVLLAGGIGGMLHCLRSFRAFVGNQQLGMSWIWWYVLRPFEGAVVALVFYFVLGGGFDKNSDFDLSNVYVITGVSALVGMFSEQAVEKLKQIAESILTPRLEKGADKLTGPSVPPVAPVQPVIQDLVPPELNKGTHTPAITVSGTGFTRESKVLIGGQERSTSYISATELSASLIPDDVASEGTKTVTVDNGPQGEESAKRELKIVA